MTLISPAAVAAPPVLLAGMTDDLLVAANFAAVFDVEMAVPIPAEPVELKNLEVGGKHIASLVTAVAEGVVDPTDSFAEAAGLEVEIIGDVARANGQTAEAQSPGLAIDLPFPNIQIASQSTSALAASTNDPVEKADPLTQSLVGTRTMSTLTKLSLFAAKTREPQEVAEPTAIARASQTVDVSDVLRTTIEPAVRVPDPLAPAIENVRLSLGTAVPNNTPVERMLASLLDNPAERQWLDSVIRDVASVVVKSGDVRFRVEPEGYGRMTIERTADRLEISVSEPRALVIAEAARPQVLAGAAIFGVPVAGATVVLDQSGQRGREEGRQRQQIEHRDANEADDDHSANVGRYA